MIIKINILHIYKKVQDVFEKEPTLINFLIEALPIIGMTSLTVGYRMQNAKRMRLCGFVSSPSWLIYNINAGAIGAIICECFTLCSIVVGLFKYDIKLKRKN